MANKLFNPGLAPSDGPTNCNPDIYGNCNAPLGPNFMLVPARGSCPELVGFSPFQKRTLLMAKVNSKPKPVSHGVINYVKPPWDGVL